MQNLTPCLWYDGKAEEAANLYVSIFKNSKILAIDRYSEEVSQASGQPAGSVMTVLFELDGREFLALNGGPIYTFTPAVSFMVYCDTQAEIDRYWDKLSEGGQEMECGWVQDKYGLSWQILPTVFGELMQGSDPQRQERVMNAMLNMTKIDIETLMKA